MFHFPMDHRTQGFVQQLAPLLSRQTGLTRFLTQQVDTPPLQHWNSPAFGADRKRLNKGLSLPVFSFRVNKPPRDHRQIAVTLYGNSE